MMVRNPDLETDFYDPISRVRPPVVTVTPTNPSGWIVVSPDDAPVVPIQAATSQVVTVDTTPSTTATGTASTTAYSVGSLLAQYGPLIAAALVALWLFSGKGKF